MLPVALKYYYSHDANLIFSFFQGFSFVQTLKLGTWSEQSGLNMSNLSIYERRKDLLGATLATTVANWSPFMRGRPMSELKLEHCNETDILLLYYIFSFKALSKNHCFQVINSYKNDNSSFVSKRISSKNVSKLMRQI